MIIRTGFIMFSMILCNCAVRDFNSLGLEYERDGSELIVMDNEAGNIPPKPNCSVTLTAEPDPFVTDDPTSKAKLTLKRDLFGNQSGEIIFYALLVALRDYRESPENGTWNNERWPSLPNWKWGNTSYQVTPPRWNPFRNSCLSEVSYILGDDSCDSDRYYCNVPLRENTKYALKIRAFTDSGYQDTDNICFKTFGVLPLTEIIYMLGVCFIVTAAAVSISIFNFGEFFDWTFVGAISGEDTIILTLICSGRIIKEEPNLLKGWFKRMCVFPGRKAKDASPVPEALSQKSFLKYAQQLLSTPGRLGNEFYLLGSLSSDVSTLCLHAQRIDNKHKNRYGNILPFDMTRVKLSIIDDDPSTDYINASFIKGHKQEIQYIASQGPKEETCHDFYRMIIEQNVDLIVMLTELNEKGISKCFKYYPDKDEVLKFKDILVACIESEVLDVCTKRVLAISTSGRNLLVTHLHFKEWRDFESPEDTEIMLKFCELANKQPCKGYILVHCSSGAGRTGTFLAIDILLQELKTNSKISVFNTILKLRQQRINLVQTEAQLGYVYKCICRAIEKSLSQTKEM